MDQTLKSERRQLNSVFLLLLSTGLFWTICVSVSNYIGKPPPATEGAVKSPERGNMGGMTPPPLPEFLKPLEKVTLDNPKDLTALNNYAEALVNEAIKAGDPALLMRAVQSYSKVIDLDPKNQKALLGMATVAFENGVFDKSRLYFERYLELNPGDTKARTDYSLSLIQSGEAIKAEEVLAGMVKENPKSFSAQLSLGLAQKVNGKLDLAKASAEAALLFAPDEKGKQVVMDFLANLNKTETIAAAPPSEISPAIAVDSFFRKHPILGPKVTKISWPSEAVVEVALAQFPIEQMPEFAKEKLKKSMGNLVSQLKMKLNIKFVSAEDGKILLDEKFE